MSDPQVLVIGSGPGGSAIAWSLASAGIQVRILEAGPRYDPVADYRLHRDDWELTVFPHKSPRGARFSHAPLQALEERWDDLRSWNHLQGRTVQSGRRIFGGYHHVEGVGGATLHFAGEAHRLHPQAMAMHSRFGVAADWPFPYGELEPYYLQAERLIGVAGPPADATRPRSAPYPLPPHAMSYATRVLGRGLDELGLGWVPNAIASLSRPYDGRPPCNYCGQCVRGCPRLDKGSADITFVDKALATGNCTLDADSRVLRLEVGDNDRVKSAIYADGGGTLHEARAECFVVACGAVETPRLLLNSTGPNAPQGLANESGQVGRHFMETLFWVSTGLHAESLGSHRGLPSDAICWDYNAPDAVPGIPGGVRFSPTVLESDLGGPLAYAQRVVGGWGREHKAAMRATFGRVLSIGGIGESLPDPGSFVDVDSGAVDEFGVPRARIHSHLAETELERLRFISGTCRRILDAAGSERLIEEYGSYDQFSATHVFGTCRMGTDPETSVVDPSCRSHRWRNLMVTDASVFPSSGGGEAPSLTIYANSLRAADGVRRHGPG